MESVFGMARPDIALSDYGSNGGPAFTFSRKISKRRAVFPHRVYRVARRVFPTILLGVLFAGVVHAQSISPADYRNVGNLQEADQAVVEILKKTANGKEVLLYHVGDDLPPNLDWMVKRLAQNRVRVQLFRISEEELQGELSRLETAPVEYQELMTFNRNERTGFRGLMDRARRAVSRLFGVQRSADLSLWVPVERSPEIVKIDRVRGIYSGITASASLGLSLVSSYVVAGKPLEPAMVIPMVTLGTWVYYNVNHFRAVGQVMSQGVAVDATKAGWRVRPSSSFYWSTSFLRSMLTNAIVQASINGPTAIFSEEALSTNVSNSILSVVSKSEIDKYIAAKTPTLRDATGRILIQPGQWTEKQAANINFWWNFSHGMIKNLHLVQFDPAMMTYIFGGLAAINLGFLVKEQLPSWINQLERFGKTARKGAESCNTLLVIEET